MNAAFKNRLQNRIHNHRNHEKEQALASVLAFFDNDETHGCFLVQDEFGNWVDPLELQSSVSFDEMSMEAFHARMDALFHDHLQAQKLAEFTGNFVKLDANQRAQVLADHAEAFVPHRLQWFSQLTDRECDVLKKEQGINLYFHLTGDYDIMGVRSTLEFDEETFDLSAVKGAAPAPSFSMVA